MSSSIFKVKEHIIPGSHIREYPRATSECQEDVLQIAVKEYIPLDNPSPRPGDVTIIGAHANGFPKELYEPLYEELHTRSKAGGYQIRCIIIADISNQGMSGVLNEKIIGNDPGWVDGARDLLQVINTLRPPRPLVGIGHSLGSNLLVNVASMHPRLLHTLILLDPVIERHVTPKKGPPSQNPSASSAASLARDDYKISPGHGPTRASTFRRDLWPSREAAEQAFKKQKFYQQWDPRVLDRWLKYGIRSTPTPLYPDVEGGATLTTTKHQEVFTFLRPTFNLSSGYNLYDRFNYPDFNFLYTGFDARVSPFYRPEPEIAFGRLKFLRPSVLYIFGELSDMSEPWQQQDKLDNTGTDVGGSGGEKEGRVKGISLKRVGHLVAMEDVNGCAEAAVPWLKQELERWRNEEKDWQTWRNTKSRREKTTVDKKWEDALGGPFKKGSKGKL